MKQERDSKHTTSSSSEHIPKEEKNKWGFWSGLVKGHSNNIELN